MIGNSKEYDIMAAVESQHWWYLNLHSQVLHAIKFYSPQHDAHLKILDAGCGTGGLLIALKRSGYVNAEGFDLSVDAVLHAQAKGLPVKQGDLNQINTYAKPESFDVIVNNDTLYHLSVSQRSHFFKSCLSLLKPGGLMILNVPALNAFAGNHDLAVGITKRFSKSELLPFIARTGFVVISARYGPFMLSPIIWGARVLQKLRRLVSPKFANFSNNQPIEVYRSDLSLPHPIVNHVLLSICRLEQGIPFSMPWGSSLFMILKKSDHF